MQKNRVIFLALFLTLVFTCTFAFVACTPTQDDKDDNKEVKIVAQGTVDDAHGIPFHFLYQEYSDGKVAIYRMQGGGTYKAKAMALDYNASIVKTTDKDGDTEVKLTVTGYTFDALGQDFSQYKDPAYTHGHVTTYETAEVKTTYLQNSNDPYTYDIAIPWEISGEHKNTTVNVKPISTSNVLIDVTKWKEDYKKAIDAENNGSDTPDQPESNVVATFSGVAADGTTGAEIVLNKDYTVSATIGYSSGGVIRMTYFTQSGVWNCVNGQFILFMNKQLDHDEETVVSATYSATTDVNSVYSFTYKVTRAAKYVENSDQDEHFEIPVTYTATTTEAPTTNANGVTFFNSAKANDYGDNAIQIILNDGGLATICSGFYAGGSFRAYYSVQAGTWTYDNNVYTVTIGENTYTSTLSEGTHTLANVVLGDVTLNLMYTPSVQ